MSNNKQSSVEWLVEKLGKYNEEMVFLYQNEIEQAKAMHKNEITKAVQKFQLSDKRVDKVLKEYKLDTIAEKYYNETFGGEDEQQ